MKQLRVFRFYLLLSMLVLLLAACGDSTATAVPATTAKATTAAATTAAATTVAAAATTAAPATTAKATTVAATTAAAATTVSASATKEMTYLKAIVPYITGTLDALKKGDVATAKKTFAMYSDAWKGIEVYVKTRSSQLYDTIEVQNEAKAVKLFEDANAKPADIIPFVENVQKGFDDTFKLIAATPKYLPVLDEIAGMRILRVNLNNAITALKANDVATAKTLYKKFYDGWDDVEDSVMSRNKDIYTDIEAKMGIVARDLLETNSPVVATATASANDLVAKYNEGLKLLTDELAKLTGATPVATTAAPAKATKEMTYLKAIVPYITGTLDALKKGDVATAKKTFAMYSDAWKGIEVYVKTRSSQLYDTIEVQNEAKAVKLFEDANAKPADIIPFVDNVQKGFDDTFKLIDATPTYNPILDEIAGMRILRVNLNNAVASLKNDDVATAKTLYKKFYDGWDDVENSVMSRNKDIYTDIEAKMGVVARDLLETDKPVVAQVSAGMDALVQRYNDGLKLLTDELAKK